MDDEPQPSAKPQFSAEIIKERIETMKSWLKTATLFAHQLDWLGDAKDHPADSEEHALALLRDDVDFSLAQFFADAASKRLVRAESTRCLDLLLPAALERKGDGHDALHLMRRYHGLFGDESEPDGEVVDGGFPDLFVWDTYQRVSALARLVEEFPKHLRHGARFMHGWPMIVSHHLDGRAEFERVAKLLGIGAEYPLDVAPRKKRGTETPLLRFLEPLVWRLHTLRQVLIETEETRKGEDFVSRISYFWWQRPDPEPGPETVAILKLLPSLPPLTQKTAREWSRKVIVPLIMLGDAGDAETCGEPALQNIWRHRAVKSRATFQSRLHSAVTDTLERFGRPG